MEKLIRVIDDTKCGIYFTSKTDTLYSLEEKFNTTARLIAVDNGLTSLSVNERALYIKSYKKTYVVKPTDSIENLREKFGIFPDFIYQINKINYLYPGQKIILSDE